MSPRPLVLTLEAGSRLSTATEHAQVPVVHSLRVHNTSDRTLEHVELQLTLDPPCGPGWSTTLAALPPGHHTTIERPRLALSAQVLEQLPEARPGRIRASARVGEQVEALESPVTLLPAAHWPGSESPLGLLASFVLPNDPSLGPVLRSAAQHLEAATGQRRLDGYQSGLRQGVVDQVQAIWLALVELGLGYLSPPPSFEHTGQKVLRPSDVVRSRAGACLDLSALLAAVLERCGLHPVVVVVEGHAFAGVWLEPSPYRDAVHDAVVAVRKAVDAGELLVLETTLLADGAALDPAREAARRHLDDAERFSFLVDVQAARTEGFPPLAFAVELPDDDADADAARPTRWTEVSVPERETLPDAATATRDRLEAWKEKLLDLSLRNRLLNFRPGKRSVSVCPPDLGAVEDWLASGEKVAIVHRPDHRGPPDPERLRTLAAAHHARRELLADHTQTDLHTRLLELYRTGRSSLRESGAVTTYLALGMLRWHDRKSPETARHAPILLLPVHLHRGGGGRPYTLTLADEADPQLNVTLLTLLRRDHQLEHPGLDPDTLPEDHAGVDVPLVLQRVRELVRTQPTWEVENRVMLASLTFTKFLMYRDLVASNDRLMRSEVVQRIFEGTGGTFGLQGPLLAEDTLDAHLAPTDVLSVLPADPSQLAAIAASADGSSYVLQGPPGTGKSQTITNLIADTLARGQTVLFVAEKKAAIDVVHRRLGQVGLGPFTFELHSDKASKKQAFEQVRDAMAMVATSPPAGADAVATELLALRTQLNTFAAAMRSEACVGGAVHEALARLIGLRDAPVVALTFPALDPARVQAQDHALRHALLVLERVGSVSDSPWASARLPQAPPALEAQLTQALQQLDEAVSHLHHAAAAVAPTWWRDGPSDTRAGLAALAHHASTAGDLPPPLLQAASLDAVEAELQALERRTAARATLWQPLSDRWSPELLTDAAARTGLRAPYEKWAEVFLLGWLVLWWSRSAVARWHRGPLPAHVAVRDDLRRLDETARADADLALQDARAHALLGPLWRRAETDWAQIWSLWDRIRSLRAALATVDPEVAEGAWAVLRSPSAPLATGLPLSRTLQALEPAEAAVSAALQSVRQLLQMPPDALCQATLEDLTAWSTRARSHGYGSLRAWSAWRAARLQLTELGLTALVDALEQDHLAPSQLAPALDRARLLHAWSEAGRAHPVLAEFSGVTHDAVIARFRSVDQRWEAVSRDLVRARVAARMPDPHAPGEMAVIRRQLGLKRRHMSLRSLFREVPTTLRALKPCVLMSPLSVARYLDPDGEPFDLVLFDEASQIPPWDAIGAIARGRRCIVVGDSRQLPPTTFFSRGDDDDDDEVDEDRLEDMESILEEAVSSGLQELRLQWHYRSRHESLISFSNRTYYDDHLLTFPAAEQAADHLGVKLIAVEDGHYDRGGTRTNRAEAERVVQWLCAWARRSPADRGTVGVVTFNMAQQRLIEDLLDLRVATDPHLEAALAEGDEPPFVKNLENVQGDERDTILFSICYGPDATGRVAMNFGPLNKRGGERRLNVAITRARRQLRVYATLRPDQIQLSRTRAVGVHHLRAFLEHAQRGGTASGDPVSVAGPRPVPSALEAEVQSAIEAFGWTVTPKVGCSGYRIDLAVADRQHPGRYILAVECDGASYHGSASARARDRQRQEVLEGLGWRLYRVWSTEWWHDRAHELGRLQAALQDAEAARHPVQPPPAAPAVRERSTPAGPPDAPVPPVEPPGEPGDAAPQTPTFALPPPVEGDAEGLRDPTQTRRAAGWLVDLVDAVGPVHEETAYRWLVQCALASDGERVRMGRQLRLDCARVAGHLVFDGTIERHGGFLWPAGRRDTWTDWRRAGDRTADQLAPEEVAHAAAEVLRGALSISQDDLLRATAGRFGYQRLARKVKASMERGVAHLLASGRAVEVGETIRWVRADASGLSPRPRGAPTPAPSGD